MQDLGRQNQSVQGWGLPFLGDQIEQDWAPLSWDGQVLPYRGGEVFVFPQTHYVQG